MERDRIVFDAWLRTLPFSNRLGLGDRLGLWLRNSLRLRNRLRLGLNLLEEIDLFDRFGRRLDHLDRFRDRLRLCDLVQRRASRPDQQIFDRLRLRRGHWSSGRLVPP